MNRLSCFLQAIALLFTIVGVSASLVPYVLPIQMDPLFGKAWTEYVDLTRMDETDDNNKSIGVLWKDDAGFHKIYGMLQSIDPSIPDADRFPESVRKPVIYTYRVQTLTSSGETIPLIVPVKVEFPDQSDRFVCLLPGLRSTIVNHRVTFWSRWGLMAAILGTLFAYALATRESSRVNKTSLRQAHELQAVTDRVTDLEHRATRNEAWQPNSAKLSTDNARLALGAGFALGTIIFVVVASVILARFELALERVENHLTGT